MFVHNVKLGFQVSAKYQILIRENFVFFMIDSSLQIGINQMRRNILNIIKGFIFYVILLVVQL